MSAVFGRAFLLGAGIFLLPGVPVADADSAGENGSGQPVARLFDWHISLAGGSVAESRGGVAKGSGAGNVANKQGELTAEVVEWYRQAAEKGNAESQSILGALYESGQGVEMDLDVAFAWYWKAAEQGNARAQYHLGAMYLQGRGVAADAQEAARWFKLASDQGELSARCAYAISLLETGGSAASEKVREGLRILKATAAGGSCEAQLNLGSVYLKGQESGDGIQVIQKGCGCWKFRGADRGCRAA
jgi:hypothetical protein